jgi:hypothetical protein
MQELALCKVTTAGIVLVMGELRHHEHKPRQWTIEEHAKLFALHKAGHTIKSICLELNRPQSSVSGRLKNTDDDGRFISHRERIPLADLGIDDELLELHSAGWSAGQIALSIGFQTTAVATRLRKLLEKEGFPTTEQPDRKKRLCITCRKPFSSDSWEHRRCCDCRRNMARSEVFCDEWSIHV